MHTGYLIQLLAVSVLCPYGVLAAPASHSDEHPTRVVARAPTKPQFDWKKLASACASGVSTTKDKVVDSNLVAGTGTGTAGTGTESVISPDSSVLADDSTNSTVSATGTSSGAEPTDGSSINRRDAAVYDRAMEEIVKNLNLIPRELLERDPYMGNFNIDPSKFDPKKHCKHLKAWLGFDGSRAGGYQAGDGTQSMGSQGTGTPATDLAGAATAMATDASASTLPRNRRF